MHVSHDEIRVRKREDVSQKEGEALIAMRLKDGRLVNKTRHVRKKSEDVDCKMERKYPPPPNNFPSEKQ